MRSFPLLLILAATAAGDWRYSGGDPGANRYSSLDQIQRSNVARLRPAWTYRTGDSTARPATTIECTPIVVNGVMYLTTARLKAVALNAKTGKPLWTFDPASKLGPEKRPGVSRGVTYWEAGEDRRILYTAGTLLFALDARTGRLIPSFGKEGSVDLIQQLDRDIIGLTYGVTSPGVIYRNLIILGSTVGEGPRPAAPGHVRAYDVRTGERAWIFHTIPHAGEYGDHSWEPDAWRTAGGANDWGGMTVDPKRGLVFLGTGSAAFDFYGGQRLGANLFANSVVALDAATGKRVWHFQTVHHDVWDYDLPCPPNLVTVTHDGRKVDAAAQVTKTGLVFLLDRETGRPLFDVEERDVPASDLPGERLWPTQPFPVKPPPFSRQTLTERDVTNLSDESHKAVLDIFRRSRYGNIYTPPSTQGTIVLPGFHGGANWGGASFDPATGRLYVNSGEIPWILTMVQTPEHFYPFDHEGYIRLQDPDGYPAIAPPWGRLSAIDLNRGEILWQIPLGEYPELTARGLPPTGTEQIGGSIVTAGGLVFVGATKDEKFRALDKDTGKLLWETKLDAGAYATPATYQVDGKQYVVIAAGGGGKLDTRPGDAFIAFALP